MANKHFLSFQMQRLKNIGSVGGFVRKVKSKIKQKSALKYYGTASFPSKETRMRQCNVVFERDVRISILVPLYNTPERYLREMIESVKGQTYVCWELCLADGSDAGHGCVEAICKEYASADARIVYKKLDKNEGISGNTNKCLEMARGEYVGLLDHDDVLHPEVLYEYAKAIDKQKADFLYCDEVTFKNDDLNTITSAHFKPDYGVDTLRANNYICHFACFKKSLLEGEELFRSEFDGSQDYDMILRVTDKAEHVVHVPRVLYYWRSHSESSASNIYVKEYAIDAARRAVSEHLERNGFKGATVTSTEEFPAHFKIQYEITEKPLVSIIIPNRDHREDLERCISSILNKSIYDKYEIIVVENGSTDESVFLYYDDFSSEDRVKIARYSDEFNYSAVNNFGISQASGEYYILLNNDCEVISEDWIEQLLMYAQREDVGAVGAKLLYGDGSVQHAGIVLGLGPDRVAGHIFYQESGSAMGYMGRLTYAQDVSAVTGACLMVSKACYEEVGGLDVAFKICLNDVDLCLKLRKAGYLNVFTPFAKLYHYESKSRGFDESPEKQARYKKEADLFRERWASVIEAGDPYFNPNLSLDKPDCRVKVPEGC